MWALEAVYELELAQLFELLKVAEAMQFSALTELCAASLANVFVSFSKAERNIIATQGKKDVLESEGYEWAKT